MNDVTIEISFDQPRSLNVASANAGNLIVAGLVKLLGWSLLETSGAAIATAQFNSGQSVVGIAAMPAGLSDTRTLPHEGIVCPQGVTLQQVTGAFQGTIYVAAQRP